jgi:hypothetical protein
MVVEYVIMSPRKFSDDRSGESEVDGSGGRSKVRCVVSSHAHVPSTFSLSSRPKVNM